MHINTNSMHLKKNIAIDLMSNQHFDVMHHNYQSLNFVQICYCMIQAHFIVISLLYFHNHHDKTFNINNVIGLNLKCIYIIFLMYLIWQLPFIQNIHKRHKYEYKLIYWLYVTFSHC